MPVTMQWAGDKAVREKNSNFLIILCIFHSLGKNNLGTNEDVNEYLLQLR